MSPSPSLSFSFAAAGWLKMYYFGCALALQHYELSSKARFAGSSAGALTASALVINADFLRIKKYALWCLNDVHKSNLNALQLRKYILKIVDEELGPKEFWDYKSDLEERLEVAVTVLPGCHGIRYSSYKDYKHFKNVLLASCTATPIAGLPFKLDGQLVADGGISDFQPLLDEHTITISPFYFHRADIKPSQYVPVWWAAYPPSELEFERLFRLGYDDTVAWMTANGYTAPVGYEAPMWVHRHDEETIEDLEVDVESTKRLDSYHREVGDMIDEVKIILQRFNTDTEVLEEQAKIAKLHERYRALHHSRHFENYNKLRPGRGKIQSRTGSHFVSDVMEVLFLFLMFAIVKPVTYTMLYIELVCMTYISLMRLLLHDILPTYSGRTRRGAYERFLSFLHSLANVNLLARAIIGPTVDIDSDKLFQQSFVFRFMVFLV
eukprot:CFRG1855T1